MTKKKKKKVGPKPEILQFEENWENAMGKAVKKEKPANGFPEKKKPKKQ